MNITTCTFEDERTTFLELFCFVSRKARCKILWTITGEQGYAWADTSVKRRKGKGKGKHEQNSLAKNKHKIPKFGHRGRLSEWLSPQQRWRRLWTMGQGWSAQKLTLHGWRYPLWILLTIRHTWFLTLAAHGRLDRERQSKDWRSMHGIRRNLAVVMSPSCSPSPRQKPAWKVALSTFQRHHHVLPRLMCLRQVTCPSCFLLLRWKTWVWPLNWIQKETRLRAQLLACFLLQLRFHSGTYCVGPDKSYVSAYD